MLNVMTVWTYFQKKKKEAALFFSVMFIFFDINSLVLYQSASTNISQNQNVKMRSLFF